MASMISEDVAVNAAVEGFLRRQGAQQAFQRMCGLVRYCFSGILEIEVDLREDPDEVGRAQVVLYVKLPDSCPDEQVQAEIKQYHQRLVAEVPLSHRPLFAMVTEFVPV
jgi:hypothetical protein